MNTDIYKRFGMPLLQRSHRPFCADFSTKYASYRSIARSPHSRGGAVIADTKHGGARPNSSRLLIHAGEKNGVRCGYLESIVNWIRALRSNTAAHGKPLPLFLQIDDLHGNHVVEINDAGPLIDVSLPAGAYQVKAQIGNVRRDYTLTLVQGASFDLHLSLARDNL